MAFITPQTKWQRIKEILICAVLIAGYVDLIIIGTYLAVRL